MHGQSGISRKEQDSSSTLKKHRHVYLRPGLGLEPPELEREQGAAIKRTVTGRSHDRYLSGGAGRRIDP